MQRDNALCLDRFRNGAHDVHLSLIHIYEAVTAVFSCADTEFTARGKTVLSDGWKEIEHRYRATLKDKPDPEDGENEGVTLPELSEGQNFPNPAAKEMCIRDSKRT